MKWSCAHPVLRPSAEEEDGLGALHLSNVISAVPLGLPRFGISKRNTTKKPLVLNGSRGERSVRCSERLKHSRRSSSCRQARGWQRSGSLVLVRPTLFGAASAPAPEQSPSPRSPPSFRTAGRQLLGDFGNTTELPIDQGSEVLVAALVVMPRLEHHGLRLNEESFGCGRRHGAK